MLTIRRLYVYMVCIISLQAVAAALNSLLGGASDWLLGAGGSGGSFFTLQFAILIVGTPIYAGHWLWSRAIARRDASEQTAFTFQLYLYANQTIFLAYLTAAAVLAVFGVASAIVTRSLSGLAPELARSIITLVVMGALWAYHAWLSYPAEVSPAGAPGAGAGRALYHLHRLFWSGIGALLAAGGLGVLAAWLVDLLTGAPPDRDAAPLGLALLAAGLALWLYYELRQAQARRLRDGVSEALRWLFASAFAAAGLAAAYAGAAGVLNWLFRRMAQEPGPSLSVAVGALLAGLLVWLYHEADVRRYAVVGMRPLRWLYSMVFSGAGTLSLLLGAFALLQWAFSSIADGRVSRVTAIPSAAALALPGLLIWLYYRRVAARTAAELDEAQPDPKGFWGVGRALRRLYVLAFSGVGVALTTLGLVGLQENVYAGLRGGTALSFPSALAWLLVGLPLWLHHWRWAGWLFTSQQPDEHQSDLRKVYLYAIIYIAVNTVIVTSALLLSGILRRLMGLPTEGSLGLSLAVIVAAAGLWAYHALVLRRDIALAGETKLQESMQRLYWYLVAALGLAALVGGLAGSLGAAVRWAAQSFNAGTELLEQLATSLAALLAGLPVWLIAWTPAQREAREAASSGRQSVLRRLYLYAVLLTAIVTTLFSAITVVYMVLNAVLNLTALGPALAAMAQAFGLAVIGTALWATHGLVLREDLRRARLDRDTQQAQQTEAQAAEARARSKRWANLPVAIVDDGDGAFGALAWNALRAAMPYLALVPAGQTPAAQAKLAALVAELDAGAPPLSLEAASVIVAPWTAAGPGSAIAASRAAKVIVPLPQPGILWAGVDTTTDIASQIVKAVEQALKAVPPDANAGADTSDVEDTAPRPAVQPAARN